MVRAPSDEVGADARKSQYARHDRIMPFMQERSVVGETLPIDADLSWNWLNHYKEMGLCRPLFLCVMLNLYQPSAKSLPTPHNRECLRGLR
jgi:hypothetical protein